jgi:hypothetical protein
MASRSAADGVRGGGPSPHEPHRLAAALERRSVQPEMVRPRTFKVGGTVQGVVVSGGGRPRRVAFDALGSVALIANEAGWVDFVR